MRSIVVTMWFCAAMVNGTAWAVDNNDVDQWIQELSGDSQQLRISAAFNISKAGSAAKRAGPALAMAADDRVELVRAEVAKALGAIGPVSDEIPLVPLRKLLTDKSPIVQVRAAISLWQLDEPATVLVPILARMVVEFAPRTERESGSFDEERVAIRLLEDIGPEARPAIPALLAAVDSPRLTIRLAAVDALGAIGSEAETAIKRLDQSLRDTKRHAPFGGFYALCLSDNSAVSLRRIGPRSSTVLLSALNDSDAQVRANAANALGYLPITEVESIPALVKLLDDRDAAVRANAALALGRIGPAAVSSAPVLAAHLNDEGKWTSFSGRGIGTSYSVGSHILVALREVSPKPMFILPAMVDELKKTHHISDSMREMLRRLGPEAKVAVPTIEPLLEDPAEGLAAAMALARFAPDHKGVLERLVRSLSDQNNRETVNAARGLGDLGSRASVALPNLYALFERQTEPSAKAIIAAAILQIDRRQPRAVVELALGLKESQDYFRYTGHDEAARVWSVLGEDAQPAIGHLIEGLKDDHDPARPWVEPRSRVRSAELLIDISSQRPEIVDALIELCFESSGSRHRGMAADALGRIGPAAGRAVPALVELLQDHELYGVDGDVYGIGAGYVEPGDRAALALGKIGLPALPSLQAALKDDRPVVRERAARALALTGQAARHAVADLLSAVNDPNRSVRGAAVEALGKIGDAESSTIAALVHALADKHLSVRVAAASALGNLGPGAKEAVPELSKMENDLFQLARSAASDSLRKIRLE